MNDIEKLNSVKFNIRKALESQGSDITADTPFEEYPSYIMDMSGVEPTGTIMITENGTVDVSEYAQVNVNVPASAVVSGTKNITANGTVDVTNYASANVNVPAPQTIPLNMRINGGWGSGYLGFTGGVSEENGYLRPQVQMVSDPGSGKYKDITLNFPSRDSDGYRSVQQVVVRCTMPQGKELVPTSSTHITMLPTVTSGYSPICYFEVNGTNSTAAATNRVFNVSDISSGK